MRSPACKRPAPASARKLVRHERGTGDDFAWVLLPIHTVSEANRRGHWRKHAGRTKTQRMLAHRLVSVLARPALPCTIVLTRIAPRGLDTDNLAMSVKAVRDGIADWLGIDDKDERVQWKCEQEKFAPHTYGVLVTVREARAA